MFFKSKTETEKKIKQVNYELFKWNNKKEMLRSSSNYILILKKINRNIERLHKEKLVKVELKIEELTGTKLDLEHNKKQDENKDSTSSFEEKVVLSKEKTKDISKKVKYNSLHYLIKNVKILLSQENSSLSYMDATIENRSLLLQKLLSSQRDVRLIESEHFVILGNRSLDLKLKKKVGDTFVREERIFKEIIRVLKEILEENE